VPWYLYLALKQLFPTGRKFPFFTFISVLGVALGVMVLIVVASVMAGFQYDIHRMITDMEGEVTVKGAVIPDVDPVLQTIRATPGVAAATPYVAGPVMIMDGNAPAFPLFYGVDLDSVNQVANLARFVTAGAWEALDDDAIILSSKLALAIGARLGDEVEIYSPLLIEKLKHDEVFLPRAFRVVGILEVGHQQIDSSAIYGTLRAAQEVYGFGPHAVHGVHVRLRPGFDEYAVVAALNRALPPGARAVSWEQNWDEFLWALNLEKTINFFLLLIIVVIAAFSVMSSLLISVVRKTREIGLLGALGASTRHVALCFCAQAFLIGVGGTVLGFGAGFLILALRNDIVHGLARLLGREQTLSDIYQFSNLPSHPLPRDLIVTAVLAIAISTLAGLLPAWRAARLKPVEALRSE